MLVRADARVATSNFLWRFMSWLIEFFLVGKSENRNLDPGIGHAQSWCGCPAP